MLVPETRPTLSRDIYLTYHINRLRAARYGLEAILIDPIQRTNGPITADILQTLNQISPFAAQLGNQEALKHIRTMALDRKNDASWLRQQYSSLQSLNDTVRTQTEMWQSGPYQ